MSRNAAGLFTLDPRYLVSEGDTILPSQHNPVLEDLQTDANTPRPIVAGGTGASTATTARTNLSVYSIADVDDGFTPKVATRTALKALDTATTKAVVLTEASRQKLFMWMTGDFTDSVAGDTSELAYIPADGIDPALGCWVAVTGAGASIVPVIQGGTGANDAATALGNLGGMAKATYDPNGVSGDVFDMGNMVEATDAKIMTAAERTKLAGIEAGADVTDATNVDAAGATMNTDTDVSANSWVLDEDDMASDSATKVPTQQSVKAYVDSLEVPPVQTGDALKQLFATTAGNGYTLLKTFVHAGLYGMVGDALQRRATVSIASGSSSLVAEPVEGSFSFSFSAADVGKAIVIEGAGVGGAPLVTTISSCISTTEVTLGISASTAISAAQVGVCWGSDNSGSFQACLDATALTGSTVFIPAGNYLVASQTVSKTLNAGGALGLGLNIVGAGFGNTSIINGTGGLGLEILGPSGAFSSHFSISGIRFTGAVSRTGTGFRLTGAAHARVDCYFDENDLGLECEAVLISEFDSVFSGNTIGAYCRKSGDLGGTWGASGCNANRWAGAFTGNIRHGAVFDTLQNVVISGHCERNGANDIANGGVSDTDRGGFKFLNPEGLILLTGSFEDNGSVNGANIGYGPFEALTDASNAGINWTLVIEAYIKRTLDAFRQVLLVGQDAAAGFGHIVWNGHLENNSSYTPSASRPTFSITASAQNVAVTLLGGHIDGGDVEFAFNANVRYTILGTTGLADGVTIAGLPSASANTGRRIFVTDLGGGPGYVISNGGAWCREKESGGISVAGADAGFALTPLSSAPVLKHNGTFTVSHSVVLNSTNAYKGCRFRILRTGSGFTLDVGATGKSLASGQWCEVEYDGASWVVVSAGDL